ncbi:hypothetical protein QMZ30_11480 [Pantoea sp. EA-12]|uniref:hypothetical protein n=1 Tax=Pantoea sp. EA-12 TaxID=3043303 RepID=UPI0024B4E3C4|nr:hypothetical protein [Pantoea sp. EA-12]MDI9221523.1 hypothetical protein [Pantoea sp. EA-12]
MFSNRTIQEVVKSIQFRTNNEFDDFIIHFELSEDIGGGSIAKKETSLVKYLKDNPGVKGPDNSDLVVEIIEYILKKDARSYSLYNNLENLNNALKRDGYELTDTSVRKTLPGNVPVARSEDRLAEILKKHGFTTAAGHYDQAIASHGRGEWAAANSQLRTFVEEFFDRIHDVTQAGSGKSSQQRRQELASAGFFRSEYNEFCHNGTGFVEGFWKRLHPEGSHPGLSEEADSTFRLHLVLVVIHYYAERFDKTSGSL